MIKSLFLSLVLASSGLSLIAQNATPATTTAPKQKKELSPEDRAIRVVRMMTSKAHLTDAQAADVKQIILEREKAKVEIRKAGKGKEKKAAIDEINTSTEAKLQKILSADQWKSWLTFKEEQKKRYQERKEAQKSTDTPANPADQEDFY